MVWVITILALVIGVPLAVVAIVYLIVPVAKFIGLIFRNIFRFIGATFTDALRLIGALVTGLVFAFMSLSCLVFRRASAGHYWEAVGDELAAAGACVYRLLIGNVVRLLGVQALTEGIEQRVPRVFEEAPASEAERAARAAARRGQFEGYQIVGTLNGGGSGGRLYIARPDAAKLAALHKEHPEPIGDVVIKSFSVHEGSSLPQIVRESRALEAARKLGLVLDHELTGERFFYVMRYVPGESLGQLTPKLHAACGPDGIKGQELTRAVSYVCDLVATLDGYHRHGLWHKDIKPDNIIVSGGVVGGQGGGAGRAYLVDFGLITPLRSSMTLTTHGTEYFRDPEMVRQALRGVKVHEVDGVKFDIYGAGAVLFSVIEGSFPAHGNLSQLTKACPEAIRWIVRRAMTDYDKRYPTAEMMLGDLRTVLRACEAGTIAALRPADLPSLSGEPAPTPPTAEAFVPTPMVAARLDPAAQRSGPAAQAAGASARVVRSTPPVTPVHVGAIGAGDAGKAAARPWRQFGIGLAVVAVVVMAIVISGAVGLAVRLGRSNGAITASVALPPRVVSSDSPEVRGVTPLAKLADKWLIAAESRMGSEEVEKIRQMLARADERLAQEQGVVVVAGPERDAALHAAAAGIRVLVVRQWEQAKGLPSAKIDRHVQSLREMGFDVLDADTSKGETAAVELARGLVDEMGPLFFGGEDDLETMRAWMIEQESLADGAPSPQIIVWMAPGERRGQVKVWIVPGLRCTPEVLSAAESALRERTSRPTGP